MGDSVSLTGASNEAKLAGGTVAVANGSSALVAGTGNNVTADGGDGLNLWGYSNSATATGTDVTISGRGTGVAINQGSVTFVAAIALNGGTVTVTGEAGLGPCHAQQGREVSGGYTQAELSGGGDTVSAGYHDSLVLDAHESTLAAAGASTLTVNGQNDGIAVNQSSVIFAAGPLGALSGTGDSIAETGGATLTVTGGGDTSRVGDICDLHATLDGIRFLNARSGLTRKRRLRDIDCPDRGVIRRWTSMEPESVAQDGRGVQAFRPGLDKDVGRSLDQDRRAAGDQKAAVAGADGRTKVREEAVTIPIEAASVLVAGAGRECLAPARQDDGPQQQRLHARREHGVPGLDGELAVPELVGEASQGPRRAKLGGGASVRALCQRGVSPRRTLSRRA